MTKIASCLPWPFSSLSCVLDFDSLTARKIVPTVSSTSSQAVRSAELARLIFHEKHFQKSDFCLISMLGIFDSASASSRHVDGNFYEKHSSSKILASRVTESSESQANCFRSPFKLQMTFYHANLIAKSRLMLRERHLNEHSDIA